MHLAGLGPGRTEAKAGRQTIGHVTCRAPAGTSSCLQSDCEMNCIWFRTFSCCSCCFCCFCSRSMAATFSNTASSSGSTVTSSSGFKPSSSSSGSAAAAAAAVVAAEGLRAVDAAAGVAAAFWAAAEAEGAACLPGPIMPGSAMGMDIGGASVPLLPGSMPADNEQVRVDPRQKVGWIDRSVRHAGSTRASKAEAGASSLPNIGIHGGIIIGIQGIIMGKGPRAVGWCAACTVLLLGWQPALLLL